MAPPNAKDYCNYCMKTFGRENLRSCGRCRYCSRSCQKEAWPTHKQGCNTKLRDAIADDPDAEAMNNALSKWVNAWKLSLHSWSYWSMNLARRERDYLPTSVFFVKLTRRWDTQNSAQLFRLTEGAVLTREDIIRKMHQVGAPQDSIDSWTVRGNDAVQIAVEAEGFLRFLWFSFRDADDRFKREPTRLADEMAAQWLPYLKNAIETGDTEAHHSFIENLAMDLIVAGVEL
ncbi:hypothetical protein BDZ89DRAFT_423180 [Hymenopellis radicata]|nr:hypothetical protein BDZ89DRAFT_423180 [Hymenopellis radicata]